MSPHGYFRILAANTLNREDPPFKVFHNLAEAQAAFKRFLADLDNSGEWLSATSGAVFGPFPTVADAKKADISDYHSFGAHRFTLSGDII